MELGVKAIENIISDCFRSVFRDINMSVEGFYQKQKLLNFSSEAYAMYIKNSVGKFSLVGTTKSTCIDLLYTKVRLSNEVEREKYKSIKDIEDILYDQCHGRKCEKNTISLIDSLESSQSGYALIGNPGSGKTTAFRYIALETAQGTLIKGKRLIPIYLSLRDLQNPKKGIISAAADFLAGIDIVEPAETVKQLLKSGNCILLIDGLDEIDQDDQRFIISDVIKVNSKYNKSIVCISSRPYNLSVALPGFSKWEIQPFNFEDRLDFVKKWFSQIDPFRGADLIEKTKSTRSLLDLGSSPLLLSYLCALYYNELEIPEEYDEMYSQCVDGLLGKWDAFRNIARATVLSHLSSKKRVTLASWIAAYLFENKKIVFSAKDLESSNCLKNYSNMYDINIPAGEDVLVSLDKDFGLLVERAPKYYSFSHLSLQEYLAAKYIVDMRLEINLFDSHFDDAKWREIFATVAKTLPDANIFIRLFISKFQNDYSGVELFRKVLNVKPVMSEDTRRIIFDTMASALNSILMDGSIQYVYANNSIGFYARKASVNSFAFADIVFIMVSVKKYKSKGPFSPVIECVLNNNITSVGMYYGGELSIEQVMAKLNMKEGEQ